MNAPSSAEDSAAVLSVKIDALTQTVEHLRDDLRMQSETYVRRDVYAEKTTALDREIVALKDADKGHRSDLKDAIKALEDAANSRRIPWTAIAGFVLAAVSLGISILPKLAA